MKAVYTIPPDAPFVGALAEGLLRDAGGDPLVLADHLILLPTRRACLHLREAFRQSMQGRSALLPRMQPIGDIDEAELYFAGGDVNPDIPPAIAPLRRQLLLAQLIVRKEPAMPLDQAALLAEALARLLDEVQTERLDFSGLEKLVVEKEYAKHWEETVRFLDILTQNWPAILAEEGSLDPADHRNRVLAAQAAAWRGQPPKGRVIAAGSTGSIPATADLLDVIAALPRGAVILPGLDCDLPEDAWQEITESHPQFGMKRLLEQFGVKRTDVKLWPPASNPRAARVRLLQESMRPAEVSEEWRNLSQKDIPPEACTGLSRLALDHPQEEALAIALNMRHALETPGKTAALVTPDRSLAERVAALLDRWDIRVNDTAGTPLSARPTGAFFADILAAAPPDSSPVALLSLLKHPLAAGGLSTVECRARARQIEIDIWRRAEDADGRKEESEKYLRQFRHMLQPLAESWHKKLPLAERIDSHRRLAESIAATDSESGADRLWRGEEGEAAAEWFESWSAAARGFPPLTGPDYRELFAGLLRTMTIRSGWGLHPRLSILGPLEARLIHADLMILGGLNEGVWPPEAPADPWMSRPMKKDFGLPLPERRIGLAAHDFVQLASAEEVILTRSARFEGAPSVPSRFLMQLETVLRALGYSDDTEDALAPRFLWQEWAKALDEPLPKEIKPCAPPEPRPPATARPRELSVTEIGIWRRNPYAIYARHILGLRKLDELETELDAADHGIVIHKALEAFIRKYPAELPPNAPEELLALGREGFAAFDRHPEVRAFWWPRFERIASWFIAEEHERRAQGIAVIRGEAKGRLAFGGFTLKGRADRIEKHPDGILGIADYKTGQLPTQKEVAAGYEPQLPLLALIAQEGGFSGIPAAQVGELAYWRLYGGRSGSEIKPLGGDIAALAKNARAGLEALIAKFVEAATPYQAVPKPGLEPRFDDYAHLARLREWGRTEEDA
jgi:ATP-dependent helicase/nuclease subunit B